MGGSPQTPELQVGQLVSDGSVVLELGLKNEEKTLFGFSARHLGQLKPEPSSPIAWRYLKFISAMSALILVDRHRLRSFLQLFKTPLNLI
jgi:hypothetical protein